MRGDARRRGQARLLERGIKRERCQEAEINRFLNALSENPTETSSPSTTTGRLISAGYSFSNNVHSGSVRGSFRCGSSVRQVVDALLTSFSHPPRASAHAFSVAGGTGFAR